MADALANRAPGAGIDRRRAFDEDRPDHLTAHQQRLAKRRAFGRVTQLTADEWVTTRALFLCLPETHGEAGTGSGSGERVA